MNTNAKLGRPLPCETCGGSTCVCEVARIIWGLEGKLALAEARIRELLAAKEALIASHDVEIEAAKADRANIDWLESICNDKVSDRIEIARSLLRGGYEFGWWSGGKPRFIIARGSLREALAIARQGQTK